MALSPLLLKGYHKFVPRIQPRCWVLQITILENDHRISYVSSEHKPLFIPIGLYFIKRHVWRIKMFHKTVHKAQNLFNLSEQSSKSSTKKSCFTIFDWSKITFDQSSALFNWSNRNRAASRHPKASGFFHFDRSSQSFDRSKMLYFHLKNSRT